MDAIEIIRSEHRSIAAVLDGLRYFSRALGDGSGHAALDWRAVRALLYYLDVFPEQYHHPKEDLFLFTAVRDASNEGDATIAQLRAEHAQGEVRLLRLMRLAILAEFEPERYLKEFVDSQERYMVDHFRHMETEEQVLLPLAGRVLGPEARADLDAAFRANQDPLSGVAKAGDSRRYDELLARVVNVVPAPIGLGPDTL
jgi:hemerythrin-like domain-containing protein